jgi:hypothetical protein
MTMDATVFIAWFIQYNMFTSSNNFLDFAIGAYQSGHVVIFRSRPLANLKLALDSPHEGYIRIDATEIMIDFDVSSYSTSKIQLQNISTSARLINNPHVSNLKCLC